MCEYGDSIELFQVRLQRLTILIRVIEVFGLIKRPSVKKILGKILQHIFENLSLSMYVKCDKKCYREYLNKLGDFKIRVFEDLVLYLRLLIILFDK